jgi:4-hydroxymandelate oxidase
MTPREELTNVFEVEAMAERKLAGTVYAAIAGGDRRAFTRMIFRPRRFINVKDLDLTVELFGRSMYAPILVGPASHQQRFHPEGELAMVRGAGAARTTIVISSRSSLPIDKIADGAAAALWYQVYPESEMAPVLERVRHAVRTGCQAVCLTVGAPYRPLEDGGRAMMANPRMDWAVVEQVRQAAGAPVLLKGIMSADEARAAVEKGVQGIIVSNHGGRFLQGLASPMEVLSPVVDAVGGKVPVLIDGGFRRGTDIVKALALGARAVLVARPPLWGLAAYGSDGVATVLEMLQSETARTMGLCSMPNLASLNRALIRFVRR